MNPSIILTSDASESVLPIGKVTKSKRETLLHETVVYIRRTHLYVPKQTATHDLRVLQQQYYNNILCNIALTYLSIYTSMTWLH